MCVQPVLKLTLRQSVSVGRNFVQRLSLKGLEVGFLEHWASHPSVTFIKVTFIKRRDTADITALPDTAYIFQ